VSVLICPYVSAPERLSPDAWTLDSAPAGRKKGSFFPQRAQAIGRPTDVDAHCSLLQLTVLQQRVIWLRANRRVPAERAAAAGCSSRVQPA
jgi:hypothetical protein